MRELTAIEIDTVSGAGWLQDGLASLGSQAGAAVWSLGSNLSIQLPVLGTVDLTSISPDLGEKIGKTVGLAIGGIVETALSNVPVVGFLVKKLLGN
ncbi:hypothetical protein [Klebsiella pasteurii]|uniref:hypothetical protein n=1 Tax=Klebsiella pasteurii TaxID=2587529 RepID=UPI00237B958D|nr:hypothetical protein [Klebsiella pasteurii]MDD9651755.1 hypothetical protein [Klebsiella pasteurii]